MNIMKKLTEKQLESISGGNNMTWRTEYAAMCANGANSSSNCSPSRSAFSNNTNISGNQNTAIIIIQNDVLVNSVLAINIIQGN